jgi:hypothetical protein
MARSSYIIFFQRLGEVFDVFRSVSCADGTLSADAILRSSLYSHFAESLAGLATIRAYGEEERFQLDNENRINIENR